MLPAYGVASGASSSRTGAFLSLPRHGKAGLLVQDVILPGLKTTVNDHHYPRVACFTLTDLPALSNNRCQTTSQHERNHRWGTSSGERPDGAGTLHPSSAWHCYSDPRSKHCCGCLRDMEYCGHLRHAPRLDSSQDCSNVWGFRLVYFGRRCIFRGAFRGDSQRSVHSEGVKGLLLTRLQKPNGEWADTSTISTSGMSSPICFGCVFQNPGQGAIGSQQTGMVVFAGLLHLDTGVLQDFDLSIISHYLHAALGKTSLLRCAWGGHLLQRVGDDCNLHLHNPISSNMGLEGQEDVRNKSGCLVGHHRVRIRQAPIIRNVGN